MLNASETQSILDEIQHLPDKNLGQNFLIDRNIVNKSVELAKIVANDHIVEIGPGLGTLTMALLENHCKVYAIEKDPKLYSRLVEIKEKQALNSLSLINADAMDYPIAQLPKEQASFKIVANLPYAITTPWMDKILLGKLPEIMVLMVQKEAADRLTARPSTKHYSAISIFLGECYERLKGHPVSKNCFLPAPKVDSTLLVLQKREKPYLFHAETRKIIREIFTKRRKQIRGIVSSIESHQGELKGWVKELPSPQARPDTILPEHWIQLDHAIRTAL